MRVIGIAGWSGAGKTTLIERLVPLYNAQGLTVSLIKHAHHGFDVDQPGKDSWRHRQAGAREVMVASDRRWALMHELRDHAAPTPQQLMARLSPCDLVLVEGWKSWPIPKFEVHRPALGKPALYPHDPHIVAVGSDAPLVCPLPCLDLARIEEIAAVIFSEALELSR